MCIAIWKPKGVRIRKWALENCFAWHSHGAGFMVADEKSGKLRVFKGFFSFKKFWEAYKPFNEGHACTLHFRWATHGEKNEENCHPFLVHENLAFVHNGVMNNVKQWDENYSDTWHFCQSIMVPMVESYPDAWKDETINGLVENFIGSGNKMIFMDNHGEVRIINEHKGVWNGGAWWSNETFKNKPATPRKEYDRSKNRQTAHAGNSYGYYGSAHGWYDDDADSWLTRNYGSSSSSSTSNVSKDDTNEDERLLEELMKEAEDEEIRIAVAARKRIAADEANDVDRRECSTGDCNDDVATLVQETTWQNESGALVTTQKLLDSKGQVVGTTTSANKQPEKLAAVPVDEPLTDEDADYEIPDDKDIVTATGHKEEVTVGAS